jgi:hypothetical protein
MGDFGYLKDLLSDLQKTALSASTKGSSSEVDEMRLMFVALDSQIKNLEAYVENESRKKIIAEEKVQELESTLANMASSKTSEPLPQVFYSQELKIRWTPIE